jgi:hypothetical protein
MDVTSHDALPMLLSKWKLTAARENGTKGEKERKGDRRISACGILAM